MKNVLSKTVQTTARMRSTRGIVPARAVITSIVPSVSEARTAAHARAVLGLAAGAMLAVTAPHAHAADLVIGAAEEPQSLDPQYGMFGQIAQAVQPFVYETLFVTALNGVDAEPLLAEDYSFSDPQTLDVQLREGILFSDGSAFDSDDVAFTFERLRDPPGAGATFDVVLDPLERVEVTGPLSVRFHLKEPVADYPSLLTQAAILSSEIADAGPEDFSDLTAAVGTGPYAMTQWARGDRIEYAPNEFYDRGGQDWDSVTVRFMPNHSARVAALLAGDIDLMNFVPLEDVPALEENPDISVVTGDSNRAIYFHIDIGREVTPHVTANDGSEIPNPLRDARVREALSLALDRELIVDRLLRGYGRPTSQWIAPGFIGHNEALPDVAADPDAARALLAEAGYPDGFKLTLHGTRGLYGPDEQVLLAMASMWARIGIDTEVEALPGNVYWGRWAAGEFSIGLSSWGLAPFMVIPVVTTTITSTAADNWGKYSNSELDTLIAGAPSASLEDRRSIMNEVAEIIYEDNPLLFLYHMQYVFASRDDTLTYGPTANERNIEVLRAAPVQ